MEYSKAVDELIEKVSQKFEYNDELKTVLKKMIPSMTKGKSDESKQMLYDALERVKIFVLDENSGEEQIEKCKEEIMGNVNKDISFVNEDKGEYSKKVAPGAYVNEPVFDDNMNIVDRKAFLYVTRMSEYSKLSTVYGTTINLSHLVHELGHAWASEKNEFIQNDDGTIINNVGACSIYSKIDKEKKEVNSSGYDGLLIEEALNTIEEEDILCDMLNIDSINELKSNGYISSSYQGLITDMMRSYVEKFGKESFDEFRYSKNRSALEKIEKSLENTEAWEILNSDEYTEKKKEKFNRINELEVTDGAKRLINNVIDEYSDVYFPDNSKFTPMQKLENVFTQIYNLSGVKYNFGIVDNDTNMEIYRTITTSMISEGYVPKNQAKDIVKEDKVIEESNFMSELKYSVKTDEEIASEEKDFDDKISNTKIVEDKSIEE